MKTVRILSTAALAAAAIAVGLTGSASAAPSANATSTSFAGFTATVTGAVTATTNFKLEAVSCAAATEGMAPGVLLVNTASSVGSGGSIYESCLSGTPTYAAVALINNVATALPITMAAGHKISIIVAVSSTSTVVEIDDVTTHLGRGAGGAGGSPNAVYVGISPLSQGTLLAVPTFVSERFNTTKVNGAPLSTFAPIAIDRVTSGGVLQIKTGKLNVSGVGFNETFRSH